MWNRDWDIKIIVLCVIIGRIIPTDLFHNTQIYDGQDENVDVRFVRFAATSMEKVKKSVGILCLSEITSAMNNFLIVCGNDSLSILG